MLTLIWVILLIADKGSGTQCPENNSSISLSKNEKPTLEIPPITEGQQTTLTCTTLCCGSTPEITLTWRGSENHSEMKENKPEFNCENLTACPRRHISTLTFNASAKHHGGQVTCKVTFQSVRTNETKTLIVKYHCHNDTMECVSSNSNSTEKANLSTIKNDMLEKLSKFFEDDKVIIAAFTGLAIGIILSTVIACLITKCCRKKRSENQSENLEMVTTEAVPVMDADQAATYDGIREPEEAEGEAESVAQLPSNGDVAPKEVEYSNINFSAIRAKNPEGAVKMQDATDTEYAEIKREEPRKENAQEGSEMLEGNEQKELMSEEDNEVKQADDEEGEDVALYSSVEELMR